MKRLFGFAFLVLISFSCSKESEQGEIDTPPSNTYDSSTNQSTSDLPFKRGTEGYAYYRIPALVISTKGTILAFAEGRVNGREDAGDIDIVLKRSIDNGKTWSDNIIIKNDGVNRCQNPVPVVIPDKGRILLLTCWNLGSTGDRRIFVTYSDDDGLTWAKEMDITNSVKKSNWGKWYATGPCHGIIKEREPNKGRIIVPTNHVDENKINYSQIIYSDDSGVTWHMGAVSPVSSNESTVVELSNGNVMLNMRNPPDSEERKRIVAISSDGGNSFDEYYFDNQLTEPVCQGAILFHSMNTATNKGNILFSNPPGTSNRKGNTLKLSKDDGYTWSKELQYVGTDETGGYSDLAVFSDGTIAIFYELGYLNATGIAFKTVQLTDLK